MLPDTTIIHPDDPSTRFLSTIYLGRPAVTEKISKEKIREQIANSARTICLGHGVPQGLLGHGRLLIDETFVDVLKEQRQNIYLFCNADCFMQKHQLDGFGTGMFISEPMEAYVFGVSASADQINESNELFARVVGEALDLKPNQFKEKVLDEYRVNTSVVKYNRERLYSAQSR